MTSPDTATAAQNLEERHLFMLLFLMGVVTLDPAPPVPDISKKPRIDTKLQGRRPSVRFEHRNGFQSSLDVKFEGPGRKTRDFVRDWRLFLSKRVGQSTAKDVAQ